MAAPDLLPDAVVRYGEHALAIVDLHLPPADVPPTGTLLFLVHGGFWMEEYDRTHTRHLARHLAGLGHLVATPEYRRVGGGGGWPVTADDVEAALVALPDLLRGLDLTWERTVVTGHSAGGHLALVLASRPVAADVELVVPLAPVADLVRADELDLDGGAVRLLLGDRPIEEADPMTLLGAPPPPRVVIVHGDCDDKVPVELARRFTVRHPWAELVELPGVGHFEFLDARSDAVRVLTDRLAGQTDPR